MPDDEKMPAVLIREDGILPRVTMEFMVDLFPFCYFLFYRLPETLLISVAAVVSLDQESKPT